MEETNQIKKKIQESGLKATPQRITIYRIMRELGHASVDMVANKIKENYPSMTLATVYNVLESFETSGILSKRLSPENKMFFDITTYDHAHIFDREGKTFADHNDPELAKILKDYMKRVNIKGFKPEKIEIQIIGTYI